MSSVQCTVHVNYKIKCNNIHPKVLLVLVPRLLAYITHIINIAITSFTFPKCWKTAIILTIPKTKGEYRPISILSFLYKAFGRLVSTQINMYLHDNSLLNTRQHGFRKRQVTFLTLLDYSKAFDTFDHFILCTKLEKLYNFSNQATSLIRTYLMDRSQCVVTELGPWTVTVFDICE